MSVCLKVAYDENEVVGLMLLIVNVEVVVDDFLIDEPVIDVTVDVEDDNGTMLRMTTLNRAHISDCVLHVDDECLYDLYVDVEDVHDNG